MADFVDFEATDDNDNYDSNTKAELDANVSDVEFIEDENSFDECVQTYYAFTNVNIRLEVAIQGFFIDFHFYQETNNYCLDDYDQSDGAIDEFKDSTEKVNDFKGKLLIPHSLENKDSFYFALLFAIRYQLKNKKSELRLKN